MMKTMTIGNAVVGECDDVHEDYLTEKDNFEFELSLTIIIQCISHNN